MGGLWFLVGEMGIVGAALASTLRVGLDAALLFGACSVLKLVPLRVLAQNGVLRSLVVLAALAVTLSMAALADGGLLRQALLATSVVALLTMVTWRYVLDGSDRSFLASSISQVAATLRGAR